MFSFNNQPPLRSSNKADQQRTLTLCALHGKMAQRSEKNPLSIPHCLQKNLISSFLVIIVPEILFQCNTWSMATIYCIHTLWSTSVVLKSCSNLPQFCCIRSHNVRWQMYLSSWYAKIVGTAEDGA